MVVRVLLGAVLSALALMLWGFVFWVVLSAPGGEVRAVPDELAVTEFLYRALPQSGTYVFPTRPQPDNGRDEVRVLEAYRQRQIAGPVGLLHINRGGADPLSPRTYVRGFAQAFAATLLAAVLMLAAMPVLETFVQRAAFVFGLGLFAAVAVRLYEPIWWHLPWGHFVHSAAYHVAGWLIAGIVLAAIVRPPRGAVHMTDPSKPLWKRALDVD